MFTYSTKGIPNDFGSLDHALHYYYFLLHSETAFKIVNACINSFLSWQNYTIMNHKEVLDFKKNKIGYTE